MKKITAIIQARLASTRLPGKTLMALAGNTLLGHLVRRVQACRQVSEIIIATTTNPGNDAIVAFANSNNLKYFRGSEEDVLDRFYKTAIRYNAEAVVRVTPDCPLLDPSIVDTIIAKYQEGPYDYVSNVITPTFPDGLDVEVFSFQSLEKAWKEAKLPSEREHATSYIIKHPERFRLFNVMKSGGDLSWMRWTVDTRQDYEFVQEIFSKIPNNESIFHMEDVIKVLENHPELMELNGTIKRNKGYINSLKKDAQFIK